MQQNRYAMADVMIDGDTLLPSGVAGIDAGLTLTKTAHVEDAALVMRARETDGGAPPVGQTLGVTGARAGAFSGRASVVVQEIDAAARGAMSLMAHAGIDIASPFVLALLGTGTAFAAVRDGRVTHLGGCALGGGSFAGIAGRIAPDVPYAQLVEQAALGDRRNVDLMVSDAYPDGIGRISGEMTAAHLARPGGDTADFLAGLMNLHGESIGQIGASRARMAGAERIVLAGGFAHNNDPLVESLTAMSGLFGIATVTPPYPGYAGAIGAALAAAETLAAGARP